MTRSGLSLCFLLLLVVAATGCRANLITEKKLPQTFDAFDLLITGDGAPLPESDRGRRDSPPPVNSCAGAPPTTQTYVMGTQVISIPKVPSPAKCQGIRDPVFNTMVTRVTDLSADSISDSGIQNEYARSDPENSDGTRLVLRGNEATWYLYDAQSFKKLRTLSIAQGSQEPEPRWDPQDPKMMYHLHDTRLMKMNVETNQSTVVHDFSSQVSGPMITTGSEGDASIDRRYWCWMVEDSDYNPLSVITYDRVADKVIGTLSTLKHDIDWVSMSMSGKHCVIGWDSYPAEVYSQDLKFLRSLPAGVTGHMDLSLTADNRDVMVYQNNNTDQIAMTYLDTGQEVNLTAIPFNVNYDIGLHMSGNSHRTPGWHLISTYGASNPGGSRSWMDNHLFMVELKANPRIWRVAHTYCYTGSDPNGGKEYFAEAFATINSSGTRIYWGSNWGSTNYARIETYAALLPQGWISQVP